MTEPAIQTDVENVSYDAEIEGIHAAAFGPGRFTRAAFRIREDGPHDRSLSRVAIVSGAVVASVRLTPIMAGDHAALLLGPLAVTPSYMNRGIGRALLNESLILARQAGHRLVILIGDESYYGPFGFRAAPIGALEFPSPLDQKRILMCELAEGAAQDVRGKVMHSAAFTPPSAGHSGNQERKSEQSVKQRKPIDTQ